MNFPANFKADNIYYFSYYNEKITYGYAIPKDNSAVYGWGTNGSHQLCQGEFSSPTYNEPVEIGTDSTSVDNVQVYMALIMQLFI